MRIAEFVRMYRQIVTGSTVKERQPEVLPLLFGIHSNPLTCNPFVEDKGYFAISKPASKYAWMTW